MPSYKQENGKWVLIEQTVTYLAVERELLSNPFAIFPKTDKELKKEEELDKQIQRILHTEQIEPITIDQNTSFISLLRGSQSSTNSKESAPRFNRDSRSKH